MLSLIVAYDLNRAIGYKNKLLWKLPKEIEIFKKITYNSSIIMGSKTFDSLPGILKKREHIVITRSPEKYKDKNVITFGSLDDAIYYVRNKVAFIIGGASIYREALGRFSSEIDFLYITVVENYFDDVDTFFPEVPSCFLSKTKSIFMKDEYNKYSFTSYKFINKGGLSIGK